MIIKGKVKSATQNIKTKETFFEISTTDVDDYIDWVGETIQIMKPEYEIKKLDVEFE